MSPTFEIRKFIVIQGFPHFKLRCIALLLTFTFGSPLAGFNMFEKCLDPNCRQNDRIYRNGAKLHIPEPTHHDMAHGLRSDNPVCARNWFWPIFPDMMVACVESKKPGPAERFCAPNKATPMVIVALEFVQKLFENLKSFFEKKKTPWITLLFRHPLAEHY